MTLEGKAAEWYQQIPLKSVWTLKQMAEMFIARFADTCLESTAQQSPDISRKEVGTPPLKYNQRSKKLTVRVSINTINKRPFKVKDKGTATCAMVYFL